jgi:hypothetical protein
MARIRTIKPEFWEDEKIGILPIPCRLFFIGCWNFADDFGVIKGNPTLLKSQIFPYDENLRVSEVKKWIDALVNARMLIPIIHSGESYYIIRTFRSHQVLDNRYSKSYISKDKLLVSNIINKALGDNDDNTMCTQRDNNVITTEEKEMEKEKENNSIELSKKATLPSTTPTKKETSIDYPMLVSYFNDNLSAWLPRVEKITETRKHAIASRVKEHGKESIVKVIELVSKSDFLTGRKPGVDWKCNFDWIFKKSNFIKILEGNYDNGEQVQTSHHSSCSSKQEANNYAFEQFLRDREAREKGMAYEVEKPF